MPIAAVAATLPLPPVGVFTKTVTVPAGTPVGVSLSVTITTQQPSGLLAPRFARRQARIRVSRTPGASSTPSTPIAFLSFTPSGANGAAETFASYPGFSLTAPGASSFPTGMYEVEAFDSNNPSAGWAAIGAASLSGATITYSGAAQSLMIASGDTSTLALVAVVPSGNVVISPTSTQGAPDNLTIGGTAPISARRADTAERLLPATHRRSHRYRPQVHRVVLRYALAVGTAAVSVTDSLGNSAVFYVNVAASASNSFTVNLSEQQGVAIAFPAPPANSNYISGTITFPVAPTSNPYDAATKVTVTVQNAVPPGFGFVPPKNGISLLGIT